MSRPFVLDEILNKDLPRQAVDDVFEMEELATKQLALGLGDVREAVLKILEVRKQRNDFSSVQDQRLYKAVSELDKNFSRISLQGETYFDGEVGKAQPSSRILQGIDVFRTDTTAPHYGLGWHARPVSWKDVESPPEWAWVKLSSGVQGLVIGRKSTDRKVTYFKASLPLVPSPVQELARRVNEICKDVSSKAYLLCFKPEWESITIPLEDPILVHWIPNPDYTQPDFWHLIAEWGEDRLEIKS